MRENVAAFGGDPAAVTLAGESAVGDAVCSQLGSPGAAGLFHRAIVQSGSCHDSNVTDAILPGAGRAGPTVRVRGREMSTSHLQRTVEVGGVHLGRMITIARPTLELVARSGRTMINS